MTKNKAFLSTKETDQNTASDPLSNFLTAIKSAATRITYRKTLREFLFAVQEFEGEFEQRTVQFYEFAKNNPDGTKNLLRNYAKHLRARAEKDTADPDYLKPTVVPNKFKGIKKFLTTNAININWSAIEAVYPEIKNVQQTRGYTTDELRQIIEFCSDPLSEFLILAESSSGIRVGSLPDQTWGSIRPIYPTEDGKYTHDKSKATGDVVCASLVVYEGTPDRYVGLISIEAWDKLQSAKTYWKAKMKREPRPNDPLLISYYGKKYNIDGLRNKIYRIVKKSGIRRPLVVGQRNHDVPITHGMRKRWNKIMSELTITGDSFGNFIRKERMFGHKVTLTATDKSYFHSTIEESVPQYLQAMPELMLSKEYRQLNLVEKVTTKNQKLEKKLYDSEISHAVMNELKAKVDRLERFQKLVA